MQKVSGQSRHVCQLASMLLSLIVDAMCFLALCLRPSPILAAGNLFLRKQLALYQEHRQSFRLFWRWKSQPGRPALPKDLQALIRRMALENPTWDQECIANELLLKLGLRVSPRTVRKYMPSHCVGGPGKCYPSQRWATFIRNHAKGIVACDFCVIITATFRMLYVFVMIEHESRRLLHVNVTAHPTAPWTLRQSREAIPADHAYHLLIHDRDAIFSKHIDQSVRNMGLRVIQTPVRTPVANAICERVMGTMRRECLDFLIPLNDRHLYHLVQEWAGYYNEGRPHMSLGPGIPHPPSSLPASPQAHRYRLAMHQYVVNQPILGGMWHDYRLEKKAA
jgi:transposase InsO family protein